MKVKTPTEFQSFNDGFCDIYTVKNNKRDALKMRLCYGEKTVGYKRYYTARAAGALITRLIQVPRQTTIDATDRVVIGGDEYKIEQVQHVADTNPPVSVLALRKG